MNPESMVVLRRQVLVWIFRRFVCDCHKASQCAALHLSALASAWFEQVSGWHGGWILRRPDGGGVRLVWQDLYRIRIFHAVFFTIKAPDTQYRAVQSQAPTRVPHGPRCQFSHVGTDLQESMYEAALGKKVVRISSYPFCLRFHDALITHSRTGRVASGVPGAVSIGALPNMRQWTAESMVAERGPRAR
jgi:hypothetical protein